MLLIRGDVTRSDCVFGDWREGPCSLTCGGGVKVFTREILREARGPGVCAGETEVVSACGKPCDLDCLWGSWEAETACSEACGGGAQTLTRTRARNASGSGLHSHWSSSNETRLSLVKSFIVLLAPALLCHKEPARASKAPY